MSKGYTKQEVKAWKDWSDSRTGHMKTKTVYEVMLRYQAHDELIVDVREDIERLDGEPITQEYVEGFAYENISFEKNYRDALKDYNELLVKYRELAEKEDNSSVNEWDEVEHDASKLIAIKKENYHDRA